MLDTYGDGFIAVDAWFLAAVVVAGLVGGLLACRLGGEHGPAIVLGLVVGRPRGRLDRQPRRR